jgi:hypothetical protein
LVLPFGLNYPEFPDSWFGVDLALAVDVLQVFADGLDRDLKQACHLRLRQPDRIAFQPHLDRGLGIVRAEQNQFRARVFRRNLAHWFFLSAYCGGRGRSSSRAYSSARMRPAIHF